MRAASTRGTRAPATSWGRDAQPSPTRAPLDEASAVDQHCQALVDTARAASLRVSQTMTFPERAALLLSMVEHLQTVPSATAGDMARLGRELGKIRDEWPADVLLRKGPVDLDKGGGQTVLLCSRPGLAVLVYESASDLSRLAWDISVATMAGQASLVHVGPALSNAAGLIGSINAACRLPDGLLQIAPQALEDVLAKTAAKDIVVYRGGKAGAARAEACLRHQPAPPAFEAAAQAPTTVVLGSHAPDDAAVDQGFVESIVALVQAARAGCPVRVIMPSQRAERVVAAVKARCDSTDLASLVSPLPYDTLARARQICGTIEDGDTAWTAADDRDDGLARALLTTHRTIRYVAAPREIAILHALQTSIEARLLPRVVAGSADQLMQVIHEYVPGARVEEAAVHPFRLHFDELRIGQSLLTHRRTITEADIAAFGGVSGDYFYMHFDEIAAAASQFGRRIAHGYFVVSAAAGLFVWPGVGPVLANYGLDALRFIRPVYIGDTIQVRLTCKSKQEKPPMPGRPAQGTVRWDVLVSNQHGKPVAHYEILTLVAKRDGAGDESPSSN